MFRRVSPGVMLPGDAVLRQTPAEHFGIFSPPPPCRAGLVAVHEPSAYRSALPRKLFMDGDQAASCLPLKELRRLGFWSTPRKAAFQDQR